MSGAIYIGLGGNLGGDAAIRARFEAAARAIARWPEVARARISPLYRSDAVGPVADQPRYLNAVVAIELATALEPVAVLARLQDLERQLGRDRSLHAHQHPRPIDLDLIAHGNLVADLPGPPHAIVPHPRAHERAFVLVPLADVAGADYVLPGRSAAIGESIIASGARLVAPEQAREIAPVTIEDDQPRGDAQGDRRVTSPEDEE